MTTAVAESVERGGEALLKAIKDKKDAETRFREQLGEARDFLTNRPRTRPVKPIVVTIDELDRCRPTYAVKVLERIKHYFDVPGIVFVIATDGTNLPNAVGSVYGAKIDGELYLRKFFDYEFDLQDPDPRRFVRVLADQFDFNPIIESANVDRAALVQCIERPTDFGYESRVHARDRALDAAEIVEAFPYFAKNLGLSLRDQAQAFTLINAYFRTLPPRVVIYPPMLTFIYCLRFASPMLYHQIRADKIEWNELFNRNAMQGPALVAGSDTWTLTSTFGREVGLFAAAMHHKEPDNYARDVRRGAHQDQTPNYAFRAATDRLSFRVQQDDGDVKKFLGRAFTLADAFS